MDSNEGIKKVSLLLQELLDTLEKIDDVTFGIIAEDGFDNIPDDIQDIMYVLNNYQIEKPSVEEIAEFAKTINNFIETLK